METPVDTVRSAVVAATSAAEPEASEAKAMLAAHWVDVIDLCSDDPVARAQLRDLEGLLAPLAERSDWVYWIKLILGVLDNEPFVAIEPATRLGITGHFSGIVDNFQLQMLLMDAMPSADEPVRRITETAAAIARGEGPQQTDEPVIGAWNLYTAAALRNGSLPDPKDSGASAFWIWNEGRPSDIPIIDSSRVILLGPPTYPRTWAATRTFPRLRATLAERRLDEAEVESLLGRIEAGTPPLSA